MVDADTATKLIQNCTPNLADSAFMAWAAAQVFVMIPALAMFEGGLVRSKNVLSLFAQIFVGLAVLSVMFFLVGFSLIFGDDKGGFIGGLDYVALKGFDPSTCFGRVATLPSTLYALYECMFAVITPLLITGAFAERLTFRAYVVFIVVWELTVYYPVAHWIWGGGWLMQRGALDFAGGIVVHTTAGAAALVTAVMLGARAGHGVSHALKPHSVPLTMIGGGLLWFGWFGFNGGSAYRSGGDAASATLNTHIAASACGVVWLLISWKREGRPHTVDVMNGIIAGLAGITPVAGYCSPVAALVIGIVLGLLADGAVILLTDVLHIDDALEVSAVHGATGLIGSLATGFVASSTYSDAVTNEGLFIHGGSGKLLGEQVLAVVVTLAWSGVWSWIIFAFIERVLGWDLRVSAAEEDEGLDVGQHEGHAYLFSRLAIYEEVFPEEETPPPSIFTTARSRSQMRRDHYHGPTSIYTSVDTPLFSSVNGSLRDASRTRSMHV
ncbi:ammonium transporter [Thecamonas trahens ATCC 50062]|uniref:Ammonium transporter n=1 Tax=Thecamonas trahens ATCC 50062 TaxID=461836 RepID=A0A0L0DMP5_THETB|nr:ammonium transporter [Thecamonas trahens ATCC 50062]KNC53550.1 ammonium transporter [Thecamonas trahens ATCC 50062]|eukprot:XP_013761869.1 ammonium transporter [Thecamonas trahens ATCC 50062]